MYDVVILIRSTIYEDDILPSIFRKMLYTLHTLLKRHYKCSIVIKWMFLKVLMLIGQVHLKSILFVLIDIFRQRI